MPLEKHDRKNGSELAAEDADFWSSQFDNDFNDDYFGKK